MELVEFYDELLNKYDIISIEDGMAEDDWIGWQQLNKKLGKKVQLVGDDLLVTNVNRIQKAIEEKSCNSLLLKVNQIGTVTEAIEAEQLAFKNKWTVVVSHRSGETEEDILADLAFGFGADFLKCGITGKERENKINRLIQIEKDLNK